MVGDYGGGGMFLAFGIVCGLLEARGSGQGQVIDVAMVDGAASSWRDVGPAWHGPLQRGARCATCSTPVRRSTTSTRPPTATSISLGSIEPQFYAELLELTGVDDDDLPAQMDRAGWPALHERFTELFKTKTREEWSELLEGTDVCFAPVLTMSEASSHPHIVARGTIVEHDGMEQPAPAPRFSRTAAEIQGRRRYLVEHTDEALADWGFTDDEIAKLRDVGRDQAAVGLSGRCRRDEAGGELVVVGRGRR